MINFSQSPQKYQDDQLQQMQNEIINSPNVMNFHCLNPGLGFKQIAEQGTRSIILTTGTLKPLDTVESQLQVKFDHKLENEHVIDGSQVEMHVISKDRHQNPFRFNHKQRFNSQMLVSLGQTILECIQRIYGGVLIFFPSYHLMTKA